MSEFDYTGNKDESNHAVEERIGRELFEIISGIGVNREFQKLFVQLGHQESYYATLAKSIFDQMRQMHDAKRIRVSHVRAAFAAGIQGHRQIPDIAALMGDSVSDEVLRQRMKNASEQFSHMKIYIEQHFFAGKSDQDRMFSPEELEG